MSSSEAAPQIVWRHFIPRSGSSKEVAEVAACLTLGSLIGKQFARNRNVMSTQDKAPDYELLRPAEGSKAEPQFVHDPYPRVIDWGMPEDVHAGDFTFAVLEAALAAGASEIQLTPIEEFGEVSVHFKIGTAFIAQEPLTQIQFGLIAILLAHIATPRRYDLESPPVIRSFRTKEGLEYNVRYSKIRVADNTTAILIRLIIKENGTQTAA